MSIVIAMLAWPRCSLTTLVTVPGSKGRADRPARQPKGAGVRQFEQDWLELGRRVACSLHYQRPRNLRLLQAAGAKQTARPGHSATKTEYT